MRALKSNAPLGNILALAWISFTIFYFAGLSVAVSRDPRFPLAIGIVRTTGRTGLWITLLPTLVGLAGVIVWKRRKLSAELLLAYCAFWSATVLSGLPSVWNAKRSFCIRTFCITSPWVARLTLLLLAAPFILAALSMGHAVFRSRDLRQEIRASGVAR